MKTTILLIEDNEQNRYLVSFLLEANGYTVIQAGDGLTGIEQAKARAPHLILLDIHLPSLDGYAVARELRKTPSLINTPVVAVTSYAMPGDKEKALSAGFNGYIEKPINPDTFVAEIESYLNESTCERRHEDDSHASR